MAVTEQSDAAFRRFDISELLHKYGTPLILVVLLVVARSMSDVFLTERNVLNVLRQISAN